MKVLLVHRYFWPDSPPYASILRTVAEHLAKEGHDVDVLTAQPSYGGTASHDRAPSREQLGGVSILRAPLLSESKAQPVRRGINLALFAGQVFLRIVRNRNYDVVMAATTPPVFVALATNLAARITGARSIYHMQDIYPEVLSANNGEPLSAPLRLLRKLDAFTTRSADRVVVLSTDMRDSLADRGHSVEHVRIINNFMPDKDHTAWAGAVPAVASIEAASSFRVIFAGNLGNFQGLDQVVEAFHILHRRNADVHLLLLGDGAAETELRKQAAALIDDTVFFAGRVPQEVAEAEVASSDLALVTLNPGVIRTAFPSKTMTYLSSGTPVLAAVESESELARTLTSEGIGLACDLTANSIANAIEQAASATSVDSSVVKAFAESYASAEARLPQWASLIGELDV